MQITGRGAHGARPEDGNDPIVAGAQFVTAVQTIVSRNIKPPTESAHLEGSIRALSGGIRRKVFDRLHEIVDGLEKMFSVDCRFQIYEGVPTLENDIEVAIFTQAVVRYLA